MRQVWSSVETARTFGWLVRIHQALGPYKQSLMQESAAKGLPFVRHPVWYFGGDTQVVALMWQVNAVQSITESWNLPLVEDNLSSGREAACC